MVVGNNFLEERKQHKVTLNLKNVTCQYFYESSLICVISKSTVAMFWNLLKIGMYHHLLLQL